MYLYVKNDVITLGNYINLANTSVGGWTEGNGIFKRNGNYYLMYTVTNSAGESKNLAFTDDNAFSGGRFGFYSAGASTSYKNLKIIG